MLNFKLSETKEDKIDGIENISEEIASGGITL